MTFSEIRKELVDSLLIFFRRIEELRKTRFFRFYIEKYYLNQHKNFEKKLDPIYGTGTVTAEVEHLIC